MNKRVMKALSLLLSVIMLISVFTGCGLSGKPSTEETVEESTTEPPAETEETDGLIPVGPTNSNPLSDVRVRQALMYAIDMDALNEGLMMGKGVVANSMLPDDPEWKAEGLNASDYNPEKAKELLAAADWDPNYELDVVYYYGDQMTVDLMAAVQQYFADVGVKMSARKLEGDLAAQLWVAPEDSLNGPSAVEWDLAYAANAALAAHEYYNRFLPGFANNSHTPTDEVLKEYIDKTNITADTNEQKEAFKALSIFENELLPALPLYYQQVFIVESEKLDRGGAEYGNEQFNYDWDIVNWDIEPNDAGKKVMYTNGGPVEFFEAPTVNPGLFMSTKVLYDHLLVADGQLGVKGGQLAESYNVSDDQLAVEFVLKDNIKWHDGEAITPEDIKWSYEFYSKAPAMNAVLTNTLKSLVGYDEWIDGSADEISGIVIDGNTVTFNFTELDPNALLTFTQLPPLPAKYFENVDPLHIQQAEYFQSPVGSGPFKVKEVKMGDFATFVPFDEYHGGVAKIEEIIMHPSGESDENLVKNTAAQQVDYAYTKSIEDVTAIEDMDHVQLVPVSTRYTRMFYVNKFPKQ